MLISFFNSLGMLAYIWIEANYGDAELNLNNTPEAIVLLRFIEGIGAGDRVLGVLGPSNSGNIVFKK